MTATSRKLVKTDGRLLTTDEMRLRQKIADFCRDRTDGEMLLADGFEAAFIGTVERCGQATLACYDIEKCIEVLVAMGMTREEAIEDLEFNTIGAWMGDGTPVFLSRFDTSSENPSSE